MSFRIPHLTRIIFLSLAIATGWFILNLMSSGAKGEGLNLTSHLQTHPRQWKEAHYQLR